MVAEVVKASGDMGTAAKNGTLDEFLYASES